jgi:hypothetical protein
MQKEWVRVCHKGWPLIIGQRENGGRLRRLGLKGPDDLLGAGMYLLQNVLVHNQSVFGFPLDSVGYSIGFGCPDVRAVASVVLYREAKEPGVDCMRLLQNSVLWLFMDKKMRATWGNVCGIA